MSGHHCVEALELRLLMDARFTWIDLDGGAWQTTTNWQRVLGQSTSGYPSTSGDIATFEVENRAQTIFFNRNESIPIVQVVEGQPTFDLNGYTLRLVGLPGGLVVSSDRTPEYTPRMGVDVPKASIVDGTVVASSVFVGGLARESRPPSPDDAELTVGAGGILQVGQFGMQVGYTSNGTTWGTGTVRINGGGKIIHDFDYTVNVTGSVLINHSGSEWRGADIDFRQGGSSLYVENGGRFSGGVSGSSGGNNIADTVIVQGNASFNGSLFSGDNGVRFLAYNGATVETSFVNVSRSNTAVPKPVFLVEDPGTTWSNLGNVSVGGRNGSDQNSSKYGGILAINDGGQATILGTLNVGFQGEVHLLSGGLSVQGISLGADTVFNWETGRLTINGGTVTGTSGFWRQDATILNGGKTLELLGGATISRNALTVSNDSTVRLIGGSAFTTSTVSSAGTITVEDSTLTGTITATGGTLEGRGTINGLVRMDGTSPVTLAVRQGALKTYDLDLHDRTTFFTEFTSERNAQLQATGTVRLDEAELRFHIPTQRSFGRGEQVVLIQNDGTDAIVGKFRFREEGVYRTLNEGSRFIHSGREWEISYRGGDGNDVSIMEVLPPVASSLVGFVNGNWWIASADGEGNYSSRIAATGPASTFRRVVQGDFNGDGREDIAVWMSNREWRVGIANESGQFIYTTWTTWASSEIKEIHVGDFNNDGRDDIIGLFKNENRGRWWVAISEGDKFVNRHWGDHGNYNGIHTVLVGNFDGVKGDDLSIVATSGLVWMAKTSNTRFQYLESHRWNLTNGFHFAQVGNFNGDTRDDILAVFGNGVTRSVYVAKSLGPAEGFYSSKWTELTVTQSLDAVVVGDFDGDGRSNVALLLNGTKLWCGRSNGQRFAMEHWLNWTAVSEGFESIAVGDSNADGLADIIARVPNGTWYSAQSTGSSFVNRNLVQWSATADWQYVRVGQFTTPAPRSSGAAVSEDQNLAATARRWMDLSAQPLPNPAGEQHKVLPQLPAGEAFGASFDDFGSGDLLEYLARLAL
ncbi:FG-GAP repeat domain-containing protein [Rubinisphaera margarita]|uniref:FG-GAP repeat domain-containing protein n=1 Tax=Rubinisphaera margarita TaxID=2909586 RepID=UPI001EE8F964|nr:VCBS repeat-containing protein [Rubinisphaera margarita]MCG6154396.1 hypothetical protein [Rubinisphaera margarita]